MGGKAKKVQQTPEEKALLRAQLLTINKQDDEINQRKQRILKGQYTSFAGLLKTSGRTPVTTTPRSGSQAIPIGLPVTPAVAPRLTRA